MYMSRNDKNVMTSTNFDKTLKAISLFCLEHKGFNIKFYACAYVYLLLKYIYKHFLMAQLECRRWSTTLVSKNQHWCGIRFVERTNLNYSDSLNELIHIVRSKLRSSNKFLKSPCNFKGHHDEKGYEITV